MLTALNLLKNCFQFIEECVKCVAQISFGNSLKSFFGSDIFRLDSLCFLRVEMILGTFAGELRNL